MDANRKRQLALLVVEGRSIGECAEWAGYTYQGMLGLLHSDEMKSLIEDKQAAVEQAVVNGRTKVLLHTEELIGRSLDIALAGTEHSDLDITDVSIGESGRERRWLIDKIWPTVTHVEEHHKEEVHIGVEVAIREGFSQLGDTFKDIPTFDITSSPHVLEGEAATPQAVALGAQHTPADPPSTLPHDIVIPPSASDD